MNETLKNLILQKEIAYQDESACSGVLSQSGFLYAGGQKIKKVGIFAWFMVKSGV